MGAMFGPIFGALPIPAMFGPIFGQGAAPLVPARGPNGVSTLVLNMAQGAETVYQFKTDVIPMHDGHERRIELIGCPRELYKFDTTLTDAQVAAIQAVIGYKGAQAAVFLVALTYEALTLTVDTTTSTITVLDTSKSDWLYPGCRCLVISRDGATKLERVVQSKTATTIELDDVVSAAAGKAGSLIMPLMPCYLQPNQELGQYAVNAGEFDFTAEGILFGDQNSNWNPQGATVTTYTDPVSAAVVPVWDRRVDVEGAEPNARNLVLGNELIDRGAVLWNKGTKLFSSFARQARFTIRDDSDRQFFKKFIGTVMGRRKVFLLPTWQPDLGTIVGDASTGTIVMQSSLAELADYHNMWRNSEAHKWLQLWKADGTVAYRRVMDSVDNGNGTQSLLLDSAVVGAIQMVSLLELCRLNTDDPAITWEGRFGYTDLPALVVQQAV